MTMLLVIFVLADVLLAIWPSLFAMTMLLSVFEIADVDFIFNEV